MAVSSGMVGSGGEAAAGARFDKEEYAKALSSSDAPELKAMAERLAKSQSEMNQMLDELQADNTQCRQESETLRKTIELVMMEMQKLNIGSLNTTDPSLEEGPLNFVNRFWEKMRPRDTAFVVNENVGELKRISVQGEPGSGPAGAGVKQIANLGEKGLEKLQETLGNGELGQKALEKSKEVSQKAVEVGQKGLEQGKQAVEHSKQAWGKLSQSIGPLWQTGLSRAEGLLGGYGGGSAPEEKKPKKKKKKEQGAAPSGEVLATQGACVAPAGGLGSLAEETEESTAAPSAAAAAVAAPSAAAATTEAEQETAPEAFEGPNADEQISSTILIEATLTLDDGSVQTLQVRAADRCKEVANRFVQEHSLKAWFVDPLTAWLKNVEAEAEKFPVTVEGDLMEIRKKHQKK